MNSPLTTATEPVLILEGCALAMLRTLPDACVDAIVTSPPYWGLRDYGIEPTDWPACSYAPMPGLPAIEVPAERSCLGLEPTLHAFLAHLVLIFEECRRVLKPTAKGCKKQVQDKRDTEADAQDQGSNHQKDGHMPGWANHTTTRGWQPTCDCADRSGRAPIVLDPFGGSGTTAQVALEHGRHAILIERGPHNIALIRKRLAPVLAAPVLHLA